MLKERLFARWKVVCLCAAVITATVANVLCTAAPARADILLLEPTSALRCTSTSISSCSNLTGMDLPSGWYVETVPNDLQDYDVNNRMSVDFDGWIFPASDLDGYDYLAFSYAYDVWENSDWTYSIPYSVYYQNGTSTSSLGWTGYRLIYEKAGLNSSGYLIVVYRISTAPNGGYLRVPGLPQLLLDTGDTRITAPELEDKVEATTEAVEKNTEAVEDLKESILDTSGSDRIVSGIVPGDQSAESNWLLDRLGFIGTIIQVPYEVFSALIGGSGSGRFTFPGYSMQIAGVDFSIPPMDVDVWSVVPSEVQVIIRVTLTLVCFLAFGKGIESIYRRFTGEEQAVQVVNDD